MTDPQYPGLTGHPLERTGPQVLPEFGGAVPAEEGVTVSEEYLLTSQALWIAVALTGAAVLARIFLHMQNETPGPDEA